jgi:hypothetical protein
VPGGYGTDETNGRQLPLFRPGVAVAEPT